jgi:D-alanyl-D-alanine carboxypeptidase/D-alanyl-D-alanine-endopeptidase (penicillin-binding protein 4)
MHRTLRFTTASFFALFTLVTGCSETKPPEPTATSPTKSATTPNEQPAKDKTAVNKPLIVPPDNPDAATNAKALNYVKTLPGTSQSQGVWIQSGDTLLANHQGTVPLPAASITKVATSLVALQTFGPDHRFITEIGSTGAIENGTLKGDLVIQGGEDPFFVWEEAVAVGNLLNQMGIKRVTGNLVIVGKFYMNYKTNPQTAGNLLKIGLSSQNWTPEAANQYATLPPGTAKPQVVIDGGVKVLPEAPSNVKPLLRHSSFPLAELLKKMNQYSNNYMAEIIANAVGGPKVVAEKAAQAAGVPTTEIQLVNGSGLAVENRISPRAATAMFRAVESYLQAHQMTVADVFTIVGQDKGILQPRPLPRLAVVKSGSLDNVSALVGALPTQKQGTVWFAIMNSGGNLEQFRAQQETLLNSFARQWGEVNTPPAELTRNPARESKISSSEIVK